MHAHVPGRKRAALEAIRKESASAGLRWRSRFQGLLRGVSQPLRVPRPPFVPALFVVRFAPALADPFVPRLLDVLFEAARFDAAPVLRFEAEAARFAALFEAAPAACFEAAAPRFAGAFRAALFTPALEPTAFELLRSPLVEPFAAAAFVPRAEVRAAPARPARAPAFAAPPRAPRAPRAPPLARFVDDEPRPAPPFRRLSGRRATNLKKRLVPPDAASS